MNLLKLRPWKAALLFYKQNPKINKKPTILLFINLTQLIPPNGRRKVHDLFSKTKGDIQLSLFFPLWAWRVERA